MENKMIKTDFFMVDLPDLSRAEAAPVELNSEYWSPEKQGETRRLFFKEINLEVVIDPTSGKDIELPVAYFIEAIDGIKKLIRQASKRLVGALEIIKIQQGTPVEITYLGKVKNKTNQFLGDGWSIKPLYVDGMPIVSNKGNIEIESDNADVQKKEIGFDNVGNQTEDGVPF